jgi:hypothetical protein
MLRLLLFGVFAPWRAESEQTSLLVGDSEAYHACALNVRHAGIYSCVTIGPRVPDNIWPPGFPLLACGLYAVTGVHPWLMLLVNLGLEVVTLLAIWRICRSLWPGPVGAIAAWLFALNPIAITNAMGYRPDTLFQCVLALFVWMWLAYVARPTWPRVLVSALLLGSSALCKPITQYLVLVVAVLLWLNAWYRNRYRGVLVRTLLLVAVTGSVLAPWCLRNYRCFKTINLTSMEGASLCDYAAATVIAWQYHTDLATARAALASLLVQKYAITPAAKLSARLATTNVVWLAQLVPPAYLQPTTPQVVLHTRADVNRAQKQLFAAFVARHWGAYGQVSLVRMARMLLAPPWQELMRMVAPTTPAMTLAKAVVRGDGALLNTIGWPRVVLGVVLALVLSGYTVCFPLLAIWGWVLMVRAPATRLAAINLLVLCAYFIMLVGPQGEPRYNLLLIPMTTPLAAAGLHGIHHAAGRARARRIKQPA